MASDASELRALHSSTPDIDNLADHMERPMSLQQDPRTETNREQGDSLLFDVRTLTDQLLVLRRMQAPLFSTESNGLAGILKRIANIPLFLIHYKQMRHNREFIVLVEGLIAQIEKLSEHVQLIQHNADHIQQLWQRADALQQMFDQITEYQDMRQKIEEMQRSIERIAVDQNGQHRWLEQVAASQHGQTEWIQIIQRKLEMVALDLREVSDPLRASSGALPEPRFVDTAAYREKVDAAGGEVRLNLGAGERPRADYVNVDLRPLPETDIIADIRHLPFEAGTVSEIASAHLVEHFREHQLRRQVLPYWRQLLREGGILRIVCPNWAAMLKRLQEGRMSLAEFKLLTFGGQDYEGDDHFSMYTPETLSALLLDVGFRNAQVVADERMNGICPEMEIVAYR